MHSLKVPTLLPSIAPTNWTSIPRTVIDVLETAARDRGQDVKSLFFLSKSPMFSLFSAECFRSIEAERGAAVKHAGPITSVSLKQLAEVCPLPHHTLTSFFLFFFFFAKGGVIRAEWRRENEPCRVSRWCAGVPEENGLRGNLGLYVCDYDVVDSESPRATYAAAAAGYYKEEKEWDEGYCRGGGRWRRRCIGDYDSWF
jgi:hypothetical protein